MDSPSSRLAAGPRAGGRSPAEGAGCDLVHHGAVVVVAKEHVTAVNDRDAGGIVKLAGSLAVPALAATTIPVEA
jgi:hypothetical protein